MYDVNFIAIDFETAMPQPASICEAGICIVKQGKVKETHSWLVRPEDNQYSYWNIRVHGIHPEDTADAPDFPYVWQQLLPLLEETPILVAHNAAFDMTCIRRSLQLYGLDKPKVDYFCSCLTARHIYDFPCNKLDYLCQQFEITGGTHHRAGDDAEMCARLFLRELKDMGYPSLEELGQYRRQL